MGQKILTLEQHEQPCLPFLGEMEDDFLSPPERLDVMRTAYAQHARQLLDDALTYVVNNTPSEPLTTDLAKYELQEQLTRQVVGFAYNSGWATCERHSRIIDLIAEDNLTAAEDVTAIKGAIQDAVDGYIEAVAEGDKEGLAKDLEDMWGLDTWCPGQREPVAAEWTALRLRAGGLLAMSGTDALWGLVDDKSDWAEEKRQQIIKYCKEGSE